jgi:hypothetical protein
MDIMQKKVQKCTVLNEILMVNRIN